MGFSGGEPEWRAIADAREMALAKRVLKPPTPAEDKRELHPLGIGDSVQIQNQAGTHPTRWSNTLGSVRVLPYHHYNVVADGSRCVTLRNRKFIRRIDPVTRRDIQLPDIEAKELNGGDSNPSMSSEMHETASQSVR